MDAGYTMYYECRLHNVLWIQAIKCIVGTCYAMHCEQRKYNTLWVQAIKCVVDTNNAMRMKSEEIFLVLYVNTWELWMRYKCLQYNYSVFH